MHVAPPGALNFFGILFSIYKCMYIYMYNEVFCDIFPILIHNCLKNKLPISSTSQAGPWGRSGLSSSPQLHYGAASAAEELSGVFVWEPNLAMTHLGQFLNV